MFCQNFFLSLAKKHFWTSAKIFFGPFGQIFGFLLHCPRAAGLAADEVEEELGAAASEEEELEAAGAAVAASEQGEE